MNNALGMVLRGLFSSINVQTVAFRNPPTPGMHAPDAVDDFTEGWRQLEPDVRAGWVRAATIIAQTPPGLLVPVPATSSASDRVALALMLRALLLTNNLAAPFDGADAAPWEQLDDVTQDRWLTTAAQLVTALAELGWTRGAP
jgi:hypothetical protein